MSDGADRSSGSDDPDHPDDRDGPDGLDGPDGVDVPDGIDDPDDLAGYDTPFSRLVSHARGWLALVVALAVVLPLGGWVFDELRFRSSGEEVAQRLGADASLADALLLVRVTTCAGGSSSGSAFAIDLGDGPVVVTNRHVVDRAATVGVRRLDGGPALGVAEVRVSDLADVAVLELTDPDVLSATLVAGRGVDVGETVRLVGFPGARPFTTDGTVVAVDAQRMLVDLRTDPGASGSPVVDEQGRVVGQVFARTGQGQGVATPVGRLAEAVDGARAAPGC